MQYQGLFYLFAGFSSFLLLFTILRAWGLERAQLDSGKTRVKDQWTEPENLVVSEILNEAPGIKTFRLSRQDGQVFPEFLPGQFISFVIGDPSKKLLRSYSMSSPPFMNQLIEVSIKLIEGGKGSTWFHGLQVGDQVTAHPPAGLFTNQHDTLNKQVFVGAGIGITPLRSMILSGLENNIDGEYSLFYSASREVELSFHLEFLALEKRFERFHYFPTLTREGWERGEGRISLETLKKNLKNPLTRHSYYFCGPLEMMEGLSEGLVEQGVNQEQIHFEAFITKENKDYEARDAEIKISGKAFSYSGNESILEFLERQGIEVEFSCRVGVCGECKLKLRTGEVEQSTQAGLSGKERKQGHILSCVSRPKSEEILDLEKGEV